MYMIWPSAWAQRLPATTNARADAFIMISILMRINNRLRRISRPHRPLSLIHIYVLAVAQDKLPLFKALCERERAPYAVIGTATEEKHLTLSDDHFDNQPIDLPLDVLLGKAPKMHRDVQSLPAQGLSLIHI